MIFDKLYQRFSKDIGIGPRYCQTPLFTLKARGFLINEPSVVAINQRTKQILSHWHGGEKGWWGGRHSI